MTSTISGQVRSRLGKRRSPAACRQNDNQTVRYKRATQGTKFASTVDRTYMRRVLSTSKKIFGKKYFYFLNSNKIIWFHQGEEEACLGLPVSPHMNRKNAQMAKLQQNFIKILVGSLSSAYTSARLLPGILIEDSESAGKRHLFIRHLFDMKFDFLFNLFKVDSNQRRKKAFYSELTSNFNSNYEMWCDKVKQEEQLNWIEFAQNSSYKHTAAHGQIKKRLIHCIIVFYF